VFRVEHAIQAFRGGGRLVEGRLRPSVAFSLRRDVDLDGERRLRRILGDQREQQ
jgi:hypothetical protein